MFRRADAAGSGSGGSAAELPAEGRRLPKHADGLDGLLSSAPCFRVRLRGYDPLQVDNYVAWAESELATGRRQIDHLLARYGICSAELEISRRLLAQTPKGLDLSAVSDRVRDMFRLASDEASAMTDAAGREAEAILAQARVEADARLRKAHEIKEQAADTADRMVDQARRDRAEALGVLERARAEAAELVRRATAERDRLTGEAADARAWLDEAQAEMTDLSRRRDDARASLRRLTDRIEEALSLATGAAPDHYLFLDNRVESAPS